LNVDFCVEDTLWTGTPGNYTDPHVPAVLADVRKLVDDGEYVDATAKAVNLLGNLSEVLSIYFNDVFYFHVTTMLCLYQCLIS